MLTSNLHFVLTGHCISGLRTKRMTESPLLLLYSCRAFSMAHRITGSTSSSVVSLHILRTVADVCNPTLISEEVTHLAFLGNRYEYSVSMCVCVVSKSFMLHVQNVKHRFVHEKKSVWVELLAWPQKNIESKKRVNQFKTSVVFWECKKHTVTFRFVHVAFYKITQLTSPDRTAARKNSVCVVCAVGALLFLLPPPTKNGVDAHKTLNKRDWWLYNTVFFIDSNTHKNGVLSLINRTKIHIALD